jgi:hypothetical protein
MTTVTPVEPTMEARSATSASTASYLSWSAIFAGASVAAAASFVLISFGATLGLSVASPSSTWRDTSTSLAIVGGLWLLLTALASFGLGGYLSGRLRKTLVGVDADEVEFRDGVHGLVTWALAVLVAASLAASTGHSLSERLNLTSPTASTAEPLLAFELDRLFRSDHGPIVSTNDQQIREQAARILTTALGHSGIAPEDRAYLVQMVSARTGLSSSDAEARVNQAFDQSREAISRARRSGVILGFMIAASLLIGLAIAWIAAASGGQHHDNKTAHIFWRRWEVGRNFMVR